MLPSKEQWRKWSLPSKLTAVGAYLGILSILLTVVFFLFSNQNSKKMSPQRSHSSPPFRITYFNVGGHAINFLVKGQVDKAWEERLAGQPFIVPNNIFNEIRYLINNFSDEITDDTYLSIETTNNRVNMDIRGCKLLSFSGTNGGGMLGAFESPLNEMFLINTIVPTIESTQDWNILWNSNRISDRSAIQRGTFDAEDFILWKFVDRSSFLNFFDQKGNKRNKRIEFYKYVTRKSTPSHFFIMEFMYIMCPGCMALLFEPRFVQLRVAVIENISDEPLNIGSLYLKENKSSYLRSYDEDKKALKTQETVRSYVFPQKILKAGEKILLPLQICFRRDKQEIEEHNKQYLTTPPSELKLIGNPEYIIVASGVNQKFEQQIYKIRSSTFNRLVSRSTSDMLLGKEYIYGPSVQIDQIEVDKIIYPFRIYDPEKLVIHSGNEVGSCPYIYTFSTKTKKWVSEGHILSGNSQKVKDGFDEIQLMRFDGRVQIRENEPEASYIDSLYIKAKRKDGSTLAIPPKHKKLISVDGDYLILKQGEILEVVFDLPKSIAIDNLSLVAKGYYVPNIGMSGKQRGQRRGK